MVRFYVPPALILVVVTMLLMVGSAAIWVLLDRSWRRLSRFALLVPVWGLFVGAIIQSGASSDLWTIDPTSKAGRVTLYDTAGNVVTPTGQAAVSTTVGGEMQVGRDYKVARSIRSGSDGTLRITKEILLLTDPVEGSARNPNLWVETATTMTSAQAAPALTLNSGSSVAATVGIQEVSHRSFPKLNRAELIFRTRRRDTAHFNNNLIESGFGNPASVTAASIADGCVWRKDATGQYLPVVSFAGAETLGTPISNATFVASIPATDYGTFEVHLEQKRCTFLITTPTGVLLNQQTVEWPANTGDFTVTHVFAMHRIYNSAGTGTAVQALLTETTVYLNDLETNKPWGDQLAGTGLNFTTHPTTYGQAATWANQANPAGFATSNTACAVATLGGLVNMNSVAGNATNEYCLVGYTVPSPYTFYFTGIRIGVPINAGATIATTDNVFQQFGVAFNSSAASLATAGTYPPMRVALGGSYRCLVAQVVSTPCAITGGTALLTGETAPLVWQPRTPVAVYPGRFLHVFYRQVIGTATASNTTIFPIAIDGYYE